MDSVAIYDYILSRVNEDLTPYGYKRSGKGALFYRYSADKKVGCAIEMQKSILNSPESYSFTFNLGCIALYELSDYYGEKLTLEQLKLVIKSPCGVGIRLGHLCRGRDYWWEITGEILNRFSIEEYYNRFLQSDIIKCTRYLDEEARKKERKYFKGE